MSDTEPSPSRWEAERRFAIAAVISASRLTKAVRDDFEPAEAVSKADSSPVTVADLAAQALISMALAEALPGDGMLGESYEAVDENVLRMLHYVQPKPTRFIHADGA